VRRSTVPLKYEELAGDVTYVRQHMLQQQNVAVVGSIHLDSMLKIFKPVPPSFDTPTDTISDWLNVDCV